VQSLTRRVGVRGRPWRAVVAAGGRWGLLALLGLLGTVSASRAVAGRAHDELAGHVAGDSGATSGAGGAGGFALASPARGRQL